MPKNLILRHFSKRIENICPHKDLYMKVHSSRVCERPKLGTTSLMPMNKTAGKLCYVIQWGKVIDKHNKHG
jgi:hypothetical protein